MNKANFTFFHLKGTGKLGVRVASSLFLFFSLFFSVNMSGQTVSCNGHLNISVDPVTCTVDLTPATVGIGGDVVLVEGLPEAAISGNGTAAVSIDVQLVPAFLASGMVMDITYNLIAGTVDAPTNSCWGTFLMEDKAPPVARVGLDLTIDCDEFDPETYWDDNDLEPSKASDSYGDNQVVECTDIAVTWSERKVVDQCVADTIFRTWVVTDVKGNYVEVVDTVSLLPETLDELTLPDDFDGIDKTPVYTITVDGTPTSVTFDITGVDPLECDEAGTVWNALENGYPSPYPDDENKLIGTGVPGGVGTCGTIHATYEDLRIDICDASCEQNDASFKLLRQWTILDWCEGNVLEHNQIIKVLDTEAPEFDELPDVTISTDLWGCGATWTLPATSATDNCSADIDVTWSSSEGTIVEGVLILPSVAKTMDGEEVEVYVTYTDCCGNSSTDIFLVSVADMVPPVVVADAHTVVSLSQYDENGLAKVHASTFDDGSHDGCGPIAMSARRMLGEPVCDGYEEEDGDIASTAGFDDLWFEYLHFCCTDVKLDDDGNPIPIMIQFRVCDDANMDGIIGGTGDYCNTAMVEIEVQDKLPPACAAPADVSINCIDAVAYQDLINAGPLGAADAAKVDAAFGSASGAATCNVDISQSLTSTEDCGEGTVIRTITVTNTVNGKTATCQQTITIEADDDANFLTCDDITFPEGSLEDDLFRSYIASKYGSSSDFYPNYVWCLMNPDGIGDYLDDGENLPAIEVTDCGGVTITAPVINIDNLCSEVGINLSLDTFDFAGGGCKKILAHWEIIDQCLFVENYLYYNGDEYEINPFVPENGYFEMYVEYDLFDTVGPEITCGEGQIVGCGETLTGPITASATDDCTTDPSFFGWSWKLDVGADNTYDFSGEGNSVSPADVGLTAFPEGTHSITWIVSDGCGNISSKDCEFGLAVEDDKAPTPYCYDGLSSAVMLMNGVELWAVDFDAGSYDACSDVTVTMIPESDTEGLSDEDAYNASAAGWTFDCDYIPNGVAATLDVRIYATDASGNWDYCTASFRLQDNLGGCEDAEGGLAAIGGNIATEEGQMVSNVEVEAMTANPEFPKYTNTGDDGNYAFYSNPAFYNYEITSSKNDDFTNGVSTLDLVMIQKHILNIESLDSPYKRIAADINNDASIKASDLLQLRKLILGLYSEDRLPSNDSWRFVDADFAFADMNSPWPFDEVGNVDNLATDMMAENFVAVKVGDVNGTVQASANSNAVVRTSNDVTFELNNASFAAGEVVELNFRSSDFNEVYGYQFTLEFSKDLTFAGIEAGALNVTEANFGLNRISEGVITTSFDDVRGATKTADEVLFTVRFTANNPVEVKDAVNISSRYTDAEAYVGAGLNVNGVSVAFRTGEGTEIAETYALYQNEPNPFRGATVINFNLPKAANATLSVYDVTGKVIYKTTSSYAKGINSVKVTNLSASGVLYYQLDSDDFTATKKMIIIE